MAPQGSAVESGGLEAAALDPGWALGAGGLGRVARIHSPWRRWFLGGWVGML